MANENKTTIVIDAKDTSAAAINKFTKNITDAERNIASFGKGLSGTAAAITQMYNPMLMITGAITGAVAGLAVMTNQAIDTADEISKMAQKTGLTTEYLSTLKYAAELSDMEFAAFGSTLVKFDKSIADAATGTSEQVKAFKALGISIREQDGTLKKNDELLLAVADQFNRMPDGIEKTSIALKLFGKSGAEMIPFLNMGRQGINELTAAARDMGLQISTETGKLAEEFNDRLTTMQNRVKGIATQLASNLLPELNLLSMAFDGLVQSSTGFLSMLGDISLKIGDNTIKISTFLRTAQVFFLMKEGLLPNADQDAAAQQRLMDGYKKFLEDNAAHRNDSSLTADPKKTNKKESPNLLAEKLDFTSGEFFMVGGVLVKKNPGDVEALMRATQMEADVVMQQLLSEQQQRGFDLYSAQLEAQRAAVDEQMAMDQLRSDSTMAMFGNMSGAMQNFYQQGGKNAKTYFNLYKAFAISQAIISGKESVMHSFKEGSKWGGPVLGYIFATAAGLFAASQVASIASASMGGGGSVGAPSSSTPSAPTSSNSNNNQQQTVTHTTNIIVYGSVVDHEKFARDISPALENAVRDGSSNLVINEV